MPRLHDRFPGLRETLPHVPLGDGPSPLRELTSTTADGAPVWLKDDGAYGTGGWGGNKVRKLEWLLADARRRGSRTILTYGAIGTNHGLATALYARDQGMRTAIALIEQPRDEHVERQLARLEASGATLHHTRSSMRTALVTPWLVLRHASGLRLPYVLPPGGSTRVGAVGYVEASLELAEQIAAGQLPEPSHAVCALGSGGTAAGLLLGLRLAGLRTKLVAVLVNDKLPLGRRAVMKLAGRTAKLLRGRGARDVPDPREEDLVLVTDQLGGGYGHATAASRAAMRTALEADGLPLDPVYTAKAYAAVLTGRFDEGPVLFVNTHGPR